jgi:hypothetical protein
MKEVGIGDMVADMGRSQVTGNATTNNGNFHICM